MYKSVVSDQERLPASGLSFQYKPEVQFCCAQTSPLHLVHLIWLRSRDAEGLAGVARVTETECVRCVLLVAVFLLLEVDEHLLSLAKLFDLNKKQLAVALALGLLGEE